MESNSLNQTQKTTLEDKPSNQQDNQKSNSNDQSYSQISSQLGKANESLKSFFSDGWWNATHSYLERIKATVKEETEGLTLEKVKNDLKEFSKQLYEEVQSVQKAVKTESQRQKEQKHGVESVSLAPWQEEWKKLAGFVSQNTSKGNSLADSNKQDSIQTTANNWIGDEQSFFIHEPLHSLVEPFLSKYRLKIIELQKQPQMLLSHWNRNDEEWKHWEFCLEQVEDIGNEVLKRCHHVKEMYERYVPKEMDAYLFWKLYFWKVHQIESEECARQSLLSSNIKGLSQKEEEDMMEGWGSDEDDLNWNDITTTISIPNTEENDDENNKVY